MASEGNQRVVIEGVTPEIDGGQFPIKRTRGELVEVEADIFVDGHEEISAALLFRHERGQVWRESPFEARVNDRWRAVFRVDELGRHFYSVTAWVDRFKSWRRDLKKRADAGAHTEADLLMGAALLEETGTRAGSDEKKLQEWAKRLSDGKQGLSDKLGLALSDDLADLVERYPDRSSATKYAKDLSVIVDREKARFSSWYEMFPRSCAAEPGRHGTFKDCERMLPYIASMGFDVLYLPPIHPIGRTHRKGGNNAVVTAANDPGSPWAIGGAEGGHKSIHPELGTLAEFKHLVSQAETHGMELALDLAFQCSPDHPYVKEHPEWFRRRPDGSIQYAENPPKKYEDIFSLDFTSEQWRGLWQELLGVAQFWIDQGIRIFRVDNPHTKPLAFWHWLIDEVKKKNPDVIFLAEAFTRPKVMYRLAKVGFSQSYTYFSWRNTKPELTQYFIELTRSQARDYFRPNLWPNTPDILNEYLQFGGRPAFLVRLILAATLGASYGIYGPAFELMEAVPREAGSEEYLDSEKYQQRTWDLARADSLAPLITTINAARRDHPALQSNERLVFHDVNSDWLLAYSKRSADGRDVILAVVNLDYHATRAGTLVLDLEALGLPADAPFEVHDLLDGATYTWRGARNWVSLDPEVRAAHLLWLRRP